MEPGLGGISHHCPIVDKRRCRLPCPFVLLFPETDSSAFIGSVRCRVPEEKMFAGVALETDVGNRIFTMLPFVPKEKITAVDKWLHEFIAWLDQKR